MKESEFIDQNKDKWLEYESIIKDEEADPEELSEVFIQVTDDLSHSRSNYPNRSVRVYLNDLANLIFDKLGKKKKLNLSLIQKFFTIEVPQLMYLARREMLVSLIVFLLSMGIGIYSSIKNPEFASVVLGEDYVNMTKNNISKGEAMAVYTGGSSMDGFIAILRNNAQIDIMMLGLGMFFSIGAIWVLIRNGIMVGVFQYFFVNHGGFKDSLLTIWLHGTIEITTICLIGGVALLAGKGLLFPGSYTRYQSFRLSAGNAAKLLLMVLPFTFIAAVIEGFITRMTFMPDMVKGLFIVINLLVVIGYFILYPIRIHRRYGTNPVHETLRKDHPTTPIKLNEIKTPQRIVTESFVTFRNKFGINLALCALAGIGYAVIVHQRFDAYFVEHVPRLLSNFFRTMSIIGSGSLLQEIPETFTFRMFRSIYFAVWMAILFAVNARVVFKFKWNSRNIPLYLGIAALLGIMAYIMFGVESNAGVNILVSFGSFILLYLSAAILMANHYYDQGTREVWKTIGNKILHCTSLWLIVVVAGLLIQLMSYSLLALFTSMAINDLLPISATAKGEVQIGMQITIYYMIVLMLQPFYLYALKYHIMSIVEKYNGVSLRAEMDQLNFETR